MEKWSIGQIDEYVAKQTEQYRPEILIYVLSLVKDKDEAEDIVQETFMKFLLSMRNPRHTITYPRAYLYKIAKTTIFSPQRKKMDQKTSYGRQETSYLEGLPDKQAGPDMIFERKEQLTAITEGINILPKGNVKSAMELFEKGRTIDEISKELNQPPSTIRSNIARGKKRIIKHNSNEEGSE